MPEGPEMFRMARASFDTDAPIVRKSIVRKPIVRKQGPHDACIDVRRGNRNPSVPRHGSQDRISELA